MSKIRIILCTLLLISCESLSLFAQPAFIDELPFQGTRQEVSISHVSLIEQGRIGYRSGETTVTLPLLGRWVDFVATPNGVIDAEFMRNYPDIFTFDLQSIGIESYRGALTVSPTGVFATFLIQGKMVSIYPANFNRDGLHIIEYGFQPDLPRPARFCGHDHSAVQTVRESPTGQRGLSTFKIGDKRFRYRVAVVVTGEFYVNNGNNDSAVSSVVVATMNALSAIFNTEMSFRLDIGSRINLTYTNPATDIFIPDGSGGPSRPDQAGTAVAMHFTNTQYDIGHVFHQHKDGDGWGNGGVAQLNSVCGGGKARGWSGSYSNVGNGWINLAAHEFGHQFGANHTFNGDGGACTGAIASQNAFEIGSGTTIMSYNGICDGRQNIPSGGDIDNYFHTKSVEEMFNYVYNGTGGTCGNPFNSPNLIPQIEARPCNAPYVIPKNTPFYLKAVPTLPDADKHTYCWEQVDEDGPGTPTQGKIGSAAASDNKAPLFRSYAPVPDPARYFPSLAVLSDTAQNLFDVLPSVSRKLRFSVSVRDNVAAGGTLATDTVSVTVVNSGPFTVTRPKGGETFEAGVTETFTWTTGGSNTLCATVRIRLSIDGGKTYPIILAEGLAYSAGTANVKIPDNFIRSTSVRAMLECMDHDCFTFFNVSRSSFTINSDCTPEKTVMCPITPVIQDEGTPALNLTMTRVRGTRMFTISRTVDANSTQGSVGVKGIDGMGCAVQQVRYIRVPIYVTEAGSYTFSFNGQGWASLHRSNYNSNSPCSSFITSTGTQSQTGGLFFSGGFSATLNACTEYTLLFFTYSQFYGSSLSLTLSSPGNVLERNTTPNPAYQDIYLLVDTSSNTIAYAGASSDLTAVPGGKYIMYSAVLDNAVPPASLVGTLFTTFTSTICHDLGFYTRSIIINPACRITDLKAGSQGSCVAATNAFTQDIIVTYEKAPPSGKLNVNGQLFDITTSPQTIQLSGLDSDGTKRDVVAFFEAAPTCRLGKDTLFTAPVNCCPVTLELGDDKNPCEGETVLLDAGPDGTTYVWKKDGFVITNVQSRTFTVLSTGTYEVEVIHSSGCKKSDKIKILFQPKPDVALPATASFCEGETYTLTASVTVAQSVAWFKDGVLIPNQTGTSLQVTQAGRYKAEGTSSFGCKGQAETVVTQVAKPVVNLGPDLVKCTGEVVTLNAGTGGVSYLWQRNGADIAGASSATYQPDQSGDYRVVVTNAGQCKAEDVVKVTFTDAPIVGNFSSTLLNACAGTPLPLTLTASGYTALQWFKDNIAIAGANGLTYAVTASGNYAIEAVNAIGCLTRRETRVEVRALPVVDLGSATIVACVGSAVTLDAGPDGTGYTWQRNNTPLSDKTRTLNVSQDGTYAVTVTNQYNCASTDQIAVSFVAGPTVQLNGDKSICEGETHTISVTTNAQNPGIAWYKGGVLIPGQTGVNLAVTQSGTYEVRLTGGAPSCEVRKAVVVTVNPLPTVSLGPDKSLCEGETLPVLSAGPGHASIAWSFNGTAAGTSQTITADKSGTYKVSVKNQFGCEKSDEVIVTISPLPTLQLPAQFDLCSGTSLTITAESNATSFEWKNNGNVIAGQTTKTLSVSTPGTYQCIVSSMAGCKKEQAFTVVSRPSPVVNLGPDLTLCPDEVKVLNAGPGKTYQWSDNSTAAALTVNAGRPASLSKNNYSVTVTNDFGCKDADTLVVTLTPVVTAVVTASKPGVCNGQPVTLVASGGLNYKWTDPGGNTLSALTGATVTAQPLTTTIYTVEVTDGVCPGNKDVKTIEIKVFTPVNISAGPDTCVVAGRSIRLSASGGVQYSWDNTGVISGPTNVPNPLVSPEVETVFTVTITDVNGCIYTDDVKVCIKEESFKPVSIITPNGDGDNDVLYFGDIAAFPDNTLRIFNRWGNLIFEATGYQVRGDLFDGTRNGERLPADTYYYILTFDGQVIKSALTIIWD